MAADADHAGQRKGPALGDVKIARDQKARAALEDDVLNPILVALDRACDAGVQRRLLGPGTEAALDLLLHVADVGLGVRAALERGPPLVGLLLHLADLLDEVL